MTLQISRQLIIETSVDIHAFGMYGYRPPGARSRDAITRRTCELLAQRFVWDWDLNRARPLVSDRQSIVQRWNQFSNDPLLVTLCVGWAYWVGLSNKVQRRPVMYVIHECAETAQN